MRGALVGNVVLVGLLCGAPLAAAEDRPWVEAKSANFTVVSDAGAGEARRIAARFEQIREVFRRLWPKARYGTGEATVILAARDTASLKELLPDFFEKKGATRVAGVFFRTTERQYVALRADVGDELEGMNPYHVLYHEYVHAVLDLNFESMPVWLGEGLADYWGNTILRDDAITEGKPFPHYVELLRRRGPMPLRLLLKVDSKSPDYNEESRATVFYAQSWALVHYLLTDTEGNGPRQINTFLALLGQGLPEDDALVRAFGDLARLEKGLDDYIRQYVFRYAVKKGDFAPRVETISVREMPAAESLAVRGAFMAERGRTRDAATLLDQAARLDPGLAVVHEGRGLLAWREDRRDEARAAFAKAAELQSKSAVTHYLHGTLLLEGPEDPNGLQAAAAAFQKAVDLNHQSAPAYAMLAETLARTGAPPERTLPLARRAVGLEPSVASHHFVVARILLDAGRLDEAEEEIGRALGVASDDRDRGHARQLLDFARRRKAELELPERERNSAWTVGDLEPVSAAKYMEQACGRGDVRACAGYGAVLLQGQGIARDEGAAVAPLQKACDAGIAPSCASLGWLHHTGKGTPRDDAKAVACFAKACAGGGREACLHEANAYSEGRGVPRDTERARRTFDKACEEGLAGGCSGMGVLELRRGTGANFRRAAEMFARGCDGGDAAACANLAEMQSAGIGVARDAAESARNYRKACETGHPGACAKVGAN